jgi:thymidylate kinase
MYDSLADVVNVSDADMSFVRFFLKFVPRTDVPVFIDVPPEVAFERKGEYPVDYMKWRRDVYLGIFGLVKGSSIIPNLDMEQSKKSVENAVMRSTQK